MSWAQKAALKERIVSDLIALMKQHSEQWGDRLGRITQTLARAILNFNEKASSEDQLTMIDLYVLLTDSDVRVRFAETVKDPILKKYLMKIHEMPEDNLEPVIRRVNDWVMNEIARQVIAHRKSSIDFREIIDSGKILLVRLPKGDVGDDLMKLIGAMVVMKLWAAAKSRVDIPENERKPFFLYIDEFKNFAFDESGFDEILSEARAFRLGLTLITQYPSQLSNSVKEAVYANCGTVIAFNPQNPKDASVLLERLSSPISRIGKNDLLSLGRFTAITRLMVGNVMSEPFILYTYPDFPEVWDDDGMKKLATEAMERYGVERMRELELSATLTSLMEKVRLTPKGDDDLLSILYSLALRGIDITYDTVKREARYRGMNITESEFVNAIDYYSRLGILKVKLGMQGEEIIPDIDAIRRTYWEGKHKHITDGHLEHRKVVERVFEYFGKLGLIVRIARERERYNPDLEILQPVVHSRREYEEVRDLFEFDWLTNAKDVDVEIEVGTKTKPGLILKKVKRSMDSDRKALFVVLGKLEKGTGGKLTDSEGQKDRVNKSDIRQYVSEALYIIRVVEDKIGKRGFYKTDEVERDAYGRKLWENEGLEAYEFKGILYRVDNGSAICNVDEAKDRGWKVKKKVFDPSSFTRNPQQGEDYDVMVFPSDDLSVSIEPFVVRLMGGELYFVQNGRFYGEKEYLELINGGILGKCKSDTVSGEVKNKFEVDIDKEKIVKEYQEAYEYLLA